MDRCTCGSNNTRCWDERTHVYIDKSTDDIFEMPVGYLACHDCGRSWTEEDVTVLDNADVVDITDEHWAED